MPHEITELLREGRADIGGKARTVIANSEQTELSGDAIYVAPKGHQSPASSRQPSSRGKANAPLSQDRRRDANPLLTKRSGEAVDNDPQGRLGCADPLHPNGMGKANGRQPQGHRADAYPIPDIVAQIRAWHRRRCFAMEQRKRVDLALGAFLRVQLGWRKDAPEADRKRIAKGADDLITCGEKIAKGKEHELSDTEEFREWGLVIAAAIQSRAPWDAIEKEAVKNMEVLAVQLPVWASFGEAVRGFGPVSLAVIIAEAGDLSAYPKKGHLWKRMGVAVVGDVRQGGLGKGAGAEAWIEHGYSPMRRSRLWNIGDALIKGNRDGAYRQAYLARKEYELARDPEMKPIKAHRRAQRYMEKKLLRDLWSNWRALHGKSDGTEALLPAKSFTNERKAKAKVPERAKELLPTAHLEAAE